jgi:hypothetical protein
LRPHHAGYERGRSQGRTIWIEKNQALLERYEAILAVLKEGKTRHLAGKKGREYVGEDVHMPGTHERNTDGLVNNAQRKSQKTAEKVDKTRTPTANRYQAKVAAIVQIIWQ